LAKDWNPKIQAAYAARSDNFCIALAELEYDDPFSAIIFYDGSLKQPWGRIDVRREITAITAVNVADGGNRYAALSNEGEVYYTEDASRQELLPGAGVARTGGHGSMHALAPIQDGSLMAAGTSNQIFRQGNGQWRLDAPRISPPAGYLKPGYAAIALAGSRELYVGGSVFADSSPYDVTADPSYGDDMDEDALAELFMKQMNASSAGISGPNPAGFALYFDGSTWQNLSIGAVQPILDVYADKASRVWMVGSQGLILAGNAATGFTDVSFHGDRDLNLLSVTKFKEMVIIASDHGLHSFDGYSLSPIKPLINPRRGPAVPTPLKVQAVDDVMYYFDYAKHIHRWDGQIWDEIIIPPQLLERNFNGLP
jgi:hypothetical protein